jgi:Protein of unknown function (DUF1703).
VNNSLPTFWILIMKTTWLSTVMKRGSLPQGWLMMANGNLILNTLPDACTVMPRNGTSRKVNILFMVLLLPWPHKILSIVLCPRKTVRKDTSTCSCIRYWIFTKT